MVNLTNNGCFQQWVGMNVRGHAERCQLAQRPVPGGDRSGEHRRRVRNSEQLGSAVSRRGFPLVLSEGCLKARD